MNNMVCCISFVLIMIAANASPETLPLAQDLFPTEAEFQGWTQADKHKLYPADDMWQHIDGAADLYLKYGCQSLTVGYYQRQETEIAVEIYALVDRLNAFGVYQVQKPGQTQVRPIGAEGYLEGNTMNFYKGAFYIKLQINPHSETSAQDLMTFAGLVATKIKADSTLPVQFQVFPSENLVQGSFNFTPQGTLGLKILTDVFSARYRHDDIEAQLMFCSSPDSQAAQALFTDFSQAIARRCSTPPEPFKLGENSAIKGMDRYNGPFQAVLAGKHLIIVTNAEQKDWLDPTIIALITNLEAN
ncbi:hypothetical protein JXQ70_14745 [bacterium]|nr:hypothetical protein [bacterium]